jgi:CRP-like cAMP-binding protein
VSCKPNAEALFQHTPIFGGLKTYEVESMAQACQQMRVPKHRYAFHKGDVADGLYVVVTGHIKLAIPSAKGTEKVLDFCGPGDAFGEAGMFLDQPHMMDAQALDDTVVMWISKENIFATLAQNPCFSRSMLDSMAQRLQSLVQDIEAANLQSAAQRLIGFLLVQPREGSYTRFPFSKSLVASRLGLSPETLSRLLNQFSRAGLISVRGRVVTILQLDALRAQQQALS